MSAGKLTLPFLFLAAGALCLAEDPHVFPGQAAWENPGSVTVEPEQYLLDQGYKTGYMSRGFNYNGNLDDGTLFAIHLSQWRYGILHGWVLAFLVVTPDGKVFVYEDKLRERAIRMGGDSYSLRFEEGFVEGREGSSRIFLELDSLGCDLSLSGILPPWKPGDGRAFFPSSRHSYTRLVVPSPWASVRGWLRLVDVRIPASGRCYADRSLHCYPLRDFTNRTFYFRTFSPASVAPEDRWMLCLQVYQTNSLHGSIPMSLLLLARGGRWVFTARDFSIEELDPGGVDPESCVLPRPLRVAARCAGYELEGEFVVTRVFHVSDIEQRLPGLLRELAVAFFNRPVLYRLQGYFQGTLRSPNGSRDHLLLPGQANFAVVRE